MSGRTSVPTRLPWHAAGLVLPWACGPSEYSSTLARDAGSTSATPLDVDATQDVIESQCRYLERCLPRALAVFSGGDLAGCVEYGVSHCPGGLTIAVAYGTPGACKQWLEALT